MRVTKERQRIGNRKSSNATKSAVRRTKHGSGSDQGTTGGLYADPGHD